MEVEKETDAVLLGWIADRQANPDRARCAEALFYGRHVRYLFGVLRHRVARPFGLSDASVEDLVQDTFCRAFERARTFHDDGISDPVRLERRTRAWLGRIAQRLLADSLNRIREAPSNPDLDHLEVEDAHQDGLTSSRAAVVQEALETLSEREQDVLRVSAAYFRLSERHQRLPNAVCTELALRWHVTPDNIRAIRSRAMKKVKRYLLTHVPSAEEA